MQIQGCDGVGMKIMDVRSPAWRARAVARVEKKMLGFTRRALAKSPVFIVGLQRSGTTMLMDIFHLHPETQVFDEARDSKVFLDFRIRGTDTLRRVIDDTVLWMYREPGPNAASRLVKFPAGTKAIRAVCESRQGGGWFAEGVSEAVARNMRSLDRSQFTDFDYACLVWWARNQLFFELNLVNDPRVRLLRYETLVSQPESTMRALYDWTGMQWSSPSMRFVHARSMRKPDLPKLDPEVESMCASLLQRLDAVHARQWPKIASYAQASGAGHGAAPAAVPVASATLVP